MIGDNALLVGGIIFMSVQSVIGTFGHLCLIFYGLDDGSFKELPFLDVARPPQALDG